MKSSCLALVTLFVLAAGCAHSPTQPIDPEQLPESVKVESVMGRNKTTLQFERKGSLIEGKLFTGDDLVKSNPQVSLEAFQKWSNALQQYGSTGPHFSKEDPCRLPYLIEIKKAPSSDTKKGCRTSQNSSVFGHLIRQGETLLFHLPK